MDQEKSNSKKGGTNILTVSLLIGGAFIIGVLYNRIQNLESKVADLISGDVKVQGNPANNNAKAQPSGQAGTQPATNPTTPPVGELEPVTDADHYRGSKNAKLIMVEYSDFECPYCKRFQPTVKQVLDEYGDQVAVVYRHFPLSFHPNAEPAAIASECVAELGGNEAFWKFHDAILETTISPTAITDAAVKTGVNKTAYDTCVVSGKYNEKVQSQMAGGQKAGVTGTPGTILLRVSDGKKQLIPGALPFSQIKPMIDSLLQG